MYRNFQPLARHRNHALALLIAALCVMLAVSCHDKNIIGPNDGNGSAWRITLEDKDTLYVPNAMIKVRLYGPDGLLSVGQPVSFSADVDSLAITHSATTTDTVADPLGCNPDLIYWGNGSDDQETPIEIIHAFYVNLANHDTLARTSQMYLIRQTP